MTIGATVSTPAMRRTASICSPERSPPRLIPDMAPVPAPLTVICPVANSRPPPTSRESFSERPPRRIRAATPMAMPPAVSALRIVRRRSSRSA